MSIAQRTIHHNGNIAGLKGLAIRSGSHTARFVVDIYGKWHNGDGEHWCHYDMVGWESGHIVGYLFYEIDRYTYIAEHKGGGNYYGPETERLEKYNISRREDDERGQSVFPTSSELGIDEHRDMIKW